MRSFLMAGAMLALAACGQTAPGDAPLTTFEDSGCIGALLVHRAAVNEGRAEGDSAALTAALDAWRAAARAQLSADELAHFEASSFAVESNTDAEEIELRADNCVASAPQG